MSKSEALIDEIENNEILPIALREKYINLKKILERISIDLTKDEVLQFPSLFSRLVFISQKYKLPKSLEWQLQTIRVKSTFLQKNENNIVSISQYQKAKNTLISFIQKCYDNLDISTIEEYTALDQTEKTSDYIRLQLTEIDPSSQLLKGICEATNDIITVRYGIDGINSDFDSSVKQFWIGVQINIIDFRVDESGFYIPKYIVLEPDYLVDASAMAECFQNYSTSYLHSFRRKFETTANSRHILLGNLANFFLDELIYSEDPNKLTFDESFIKAFHEKPFEFTSCNDIKEHSDFIEFMNKAKSQFKNIQRTISSDFISNNINPEYCTLEPSFYCEKYGFQGRLDLLQTSTQENINTKIIELKSGGVPYPKNNPGKIALNHEVQTAIYRFIIKSVFGLDDRDISSYILYSAADNEGENLRLAAPYHKLEKQILNERNLIISTEHDIYTGNNNTVQNLFDQICDLDIYGKIPDFFSQQIIDFHYKLKRISETERAYLYRYITFICRELYIQKIGGNYFESNTSTASLWNSSFEDRLEAYDLISNLEIEEIDDTGRDMKILFKRHDHVEFSNFREGEICILYPQSNDDKAILKNQVLKGSIVNISKETLLLRFRYKQKNKSLFEQNNRWIVEHDKLDHTYNNMYKSLFSFIGAPIYKKELILGIQPPSTSNIIKHSEIDNKDIIRDTILQKAICAKDYFLIVGPPGTGKTSIFARKLIEYYYKNTSDNILIIAYTNRAVDELCESINQAFGYRDHQCEEYIRIGTELSCHENYRKQLLQNVAIKAKSRAELRKIITQKRIFVGTLSSIVGRPEIFDIKYFHLAIIDEASQILEPQIIGILPKVDKFIMIGDHKQLSTITLQDDKKSEINENLLNIIKLYNCNESLFERLYRLSECHQWDHAYDTLVYQGRMHEELANFPNINFYNNQLKQANDWQTQDLIFEKNINDYQDDYTHLLSTKRRHFFGYTEISNSQSDKINVYEANLLKNIVLSIWNLYKRNHKVFNSEKTLGIITPYRNQIALIKHKLQELQIPELENIMIDTVERFQGSQRDIIILSFCINKPYQLDFFSNLSSDKSVDRKLNVAITRARQQFFAIGNYSILRLAPMYKNFLDSFI